MNEIKYKVIYFQATNYVSTVFEIVFLNTNIFAFLLGAFSAWNV